MIHRQRRDYGAVAETLAAARRENPLSGFGTWGPLATVVEHELQGPDAGTGAMAAFASRLVTGGTDNLSTTLIAVLGRSCAAMGLDEAAERLLELGERNAAERGFPHAFWKPDLLMTRAVLAARRGQQDKAAALARQSWICATEAGTHLLALGSALDGLALAREVAIPVEEQRERLRESLNAVDPDPTAPLWRQAAAALETDT